MIRKTMVAVMGRGPGPGPGPGQGSLITRA